MGFSSHYTDGRYEIVDRAGMVMPEKGHWMVYSFLLFIVNSFVNIVTLVLSVRQMSMLLGGDGDGARDYGYNTVLPHSVWSR